MRDLRRAAVSALYDALLAAQEEAYRPLEEVVIPALQKSATFGRFVDDLSCLEVSKWVVTWLHRSAKFRRQG